MNRSGLFSALNSPVVGLFIGATFFFLVFGVKAIDPTYIDWQLAGDAGQHYLGWEFFRHEPWQFPIVGRIAGFGTPDGSSVFYSDSIPLLAVFFKAIRRVLPEPFQYTGLWIFACYVLQGLFGWLLSALTMARPYPRVLMTGFFVMSPALIYRCEGHHALMAHWVLLAAVYLGVQSERAYNLRHPRVSWLVSWLGLLCLSAAIHLYICLMVAILYAGAVVACCASGSLRFSRLTAAIGLPALLVPTLLYAEGAFVVKSDSWVTGINAGYFSMNLLAPLVPGYWGAPDESNYVSYFLSPRGFATGGQYEGFNYVGFGAILVVAVAVAGSVLHAARVAQEGGRFGFLRAVRPSVSWSVLAAAFVLVLLATSNVITLGRSTVFTLPLGKTATHVCAIFRSSGRFFWPASYLILWMAFHAYGRLLYQRAFVCLSVLQALFAIQVLDLSQFFKRFAQPHQKVTQYSSPLHSKFWAITVPQYKDILYYPPTDTSYYIPLGLLAAPAGGGINVAYKARDDSRILSQARQRLDRELRSGELRDNALYVFRDKGLFEGLKLKLAGNDYLLDEVDSLYVVARRLRVK